MHGNRAPWDRSPALEIRQYDPYLVAKVTVEEDNMKKALGIGFKTVMARPAFVARAYELGCFLKLAALVHLLCAHHC